MRWLAGLAAMAALWATSASATVYMESETLDSSQIFLLDKTAYDFATDQHVFEPYYGYVTFFIPSSVTLEPGDMLELTLYYPTPITSIFDPAPYGLFHFIKAPKLSGHGVAGWIEYGPGNLTTSPNVFSGAIADFTYQLLPGRTSGAPVTLGGQEASYQWVSVPEPSSWALLISGVAAVGWRLRRRPQAAASS